MLILTLLLMEEILHQFKWQISTAIHVSTSAGFLNYKVGPLLVITGVITPISRVITPVSHLFSAIYRAYIFTYNWARGPPCRNKDFATLVPTAPGLVPKVPVFERWTSF